MNKNTWVAAIVAAAVFGGFGYYFGTTHAVAGTSTALGTGTGRGFVRGGGAFAGGGATIGTVIQIGNGTVTVELPSSTSSAASTGTKLVLLQDSTQIQELQVVSSSNIQVGQTVSVTGSANSDGSVTATDIMIRPVNGRGAGAQSTAH